MGLSSRDAHLVTEAFNKCETAKHGDKRIIQKHYAGELGITTRSLQRWFVKLNLKPIRKRSVIRKHCKYPELPKWVEIVAGIKHPFPGLSLALDDALKIAFESGQLPEEARPVSVRTWNRSLEEYSLKPKDSLVRRLYAERPNQMWVIDFSRSNHFYLRDIDDETGTVHVGWSPIQVRSDTKRMKNTGLAIWVGSAVDYYSGAVVQKYFLEEGENHKFGLKFLRYAMCRDDRNRLPMAGAPESIYCDQGAIFKKKEITNILDRLGIDVLKHMPGAARSGGKVERPFRTLWKRFEVPYSYQAKLAQENGEKTYITTLDQLNAEFENYLSQHNKTAPHAYLPGETKESSWLKINFLGGTREVDPNMFLEGAKYIPRRVYSDGHIQYENTWYMVKGLSDCKGELVVCLNGFMQFQYEGLLYEVAEFERAAIGTYKGNKHRPFEKLKPKYVEVEPLYRNSDTENVVAISRVSQQLTPEPLGVEQTEYRSKHEAEKDFKRRVNGHIWRQISDGDPRLADEIIDSIRANPTHQTVMQYVIAINSAGEEVNHA